MTYLEPGVYSETKSNRVNTGTGGPKFVPLIIGSGDTQIKCTEVITRGAEKCDVLPLPANKIVLVGFTSKRASFTLGTDYKINEEDNTKIEWVEGGNAPKESDIYIVVYLTDAPDDQYTPKNIDSSEALESFYNSDYKLDGESINNIFLAGKILRKMGVPEFISIQVKPTGEKGKVTSDDYQKSLEKYAQFIDSAWRIIPVDLGASINSVIDSHINNCSSLEERKERTCVYAKEDSHTLATAEQIITEIGGYAESKSNTRISVVYPTLATIEMSTGDIEKVTGQFIATMYAGLEFSKPLHQSKTRSSSGVFNELLGVELKRTQKNKLAEKGVMIFEQPSGSGTNIICRHQLTTDMSNAETRENSVLACKDYTTKYLRNILNTYIGKYNITPDLITKVTGSVNVAFTDLNAQGWILEGSIETLAQDKNDPDTLVMTVKIAVPYPCNYIKLTIISD